MDILAAIFRWAHVVAGIMWIGHLWFFNLVNAQVAKTYDAETKKKVVPELMPRALYWFRWGAAYTWISGILLLGLVYYMGGAMVDPDGSLGLAVGVGLGSLVVGWAIYDALWKAMAKNETAGAAISWVLVTAVAFGFSRVISPRAMFIHVGALFGTIMAANVWMRIWPNQRKIIAATKDGVAPPDGAVPLAGLRSKQNTYMSVPLIFLMVSNHYPTIYGNDFSWAIVSGVVAIGWLGAKWMFKKSGCPKTAQYGAPTKTEAKAA